MMDNLNHANGISNFPAIGSKSSRLDLEVYIMGDLKYEFISFLTDCFKENFFETLSWGNIRRFQLVLSNSKNWINIYFIFLKNETNSDILINTFKVYEKRNLILLFYNANDLKSEKQVDALYDSLILERNKFYEGILSEESINHNLKKISSDSKIKTDSQNMIKNNLKFLTENSSEDYLIFKIGFFPNTTNKKTKNIKKSDTNVSYEINNEIFYISDKEDPSDFVGLMNFILEENFKKLKINNIVDIKSYIDIVHFNNLKSKDKKQKKGDRKLMHYFVKIIDWLILIYIIASFYKFLIEQN